ncbi:MAG: hypothetical protein DI606_14660 [Sphingobium sp.]|nr:MAG: hypothetical protein DI606_14660 [Sphingobium sp.]
MAQARTCKPAKRLVLMAATVESGERSRPIFAKMPALFDPSMAAPLAAMDGSARRRHSAAGTVE